MLKKMIKITIEFLGVLSKLAKSSDICLKFRTPVTVCDVISKLVCNLSPEFRKSLIDPELNDPRPNVLIMLNKKEISALEGLDTLVKNGDKLVLLPVSHGG